MWQIGNIKIKNQIVLAPMAGISNPAFISIVAEMGLGLAYTELISAEAIVRNNKKTFEMLNGIDSLDIPVGIQLFGSKPETIATAAKIITSLYQNAFIDINMGCPVPKVALRAQAGSALLKDLNKIFEIVSTVVKTVKTPVTVKIRSGWDQNQINAVEVAKVIEKAGASAITVHGRTRSQGYSGKSDWTIIKKVKEAVKIPVIGNGDVLSCFDAEKMLIETKCDAVMIGRGVLGNPWLIKDCVEYLNNGKIPYKVTFEEKLKMLKRHYNLLLDTISSKQALLEIRIHAFHYLKGLPNSTKIKDQICKTKTNTEFFEVIDQFLSELR